jgi:hypothetical protein
MQRSKLDSRAIASAGYDPSSRILEIEFSSGRVYEYADVPESVYSWLLRTPHKGAYLSRMINGRYAHRDISQPPQALTEALPLEAALKASLAQLQGKQR